MKTKTVRGGASALLLAMMVIIASCAGESTAPGVSSSAVNPIIKTASTTFDQYLVDWGGCLGSTSIAIDPDDDYPAIAYYGWDFILAEAVLKYAKWDGSEWDVTTVDDGGADVVGEYASLAFDSLGCPSIGYYNRSDQSLMWAFDENDNGNWEDDVYWPMALADNESDDFGQYCSHDISGYLFGFAFYEAVEGNLIYQVYYTDTMGTSRVEPDTTDDVGQYCSLEFSGGVPAISYYDDTYNRLKFAKYNGSTWDVEVVDDPADDVGQWTSLSYKSSGVPTIAYYNFTDTDPWLAVWNTSTSEWDCEAIVDTVSNYGMHMSHDWVGGTKAGFAFRSQGLVPLSFDLRFILYDGEDYTEYGFGPDFSGEYASFVWKDDNIGWISHRNSRYNNLLCIRVDDS